VSRLFILQWIKRPFSGVQRTARLKCSSRGRQKTEALQGPSGRVATPRVRNGAETWHCRRHHAEIPQQGFCAKPAPADDPRLQLLRPGLARGTARASCTGDSGSSQSSGKALGRRGRAAMPAALAVFRCQAGAQQFPDPRYARRVCELSAAWEREGEGEAAGCRRLCLGRGRRPGDSRRAETTRSLRCSPAAGVRPACECLPPAWPSSVALSILPGIGAQRAPTQGISARANNNNMGKDTSSWRSNSAC